ncbi:MAG: hypothetical protein PHY80_05820 [Rickettsiales bacterium]|nr:hypothetical protein [Rickettsiales bacterium]
MKKIIYYTKKLLNKFVVIGFILFLILALFMIFAQSDREEKMKAVYNKIAKITEENNKLALDIKNASNDGVFPDVDVSKNGISDEMHKYLNKNFFKFHYDINKNKNVYFNIILPKNWEVKVGKQDPFDLTNKESVVLVEVEDKESKISGLIHVFNMTAELNPHDLNTFLAKQDLGLSIVKIKTETVLVGIYSDILAINWMTGQVTRMKTFKNSSLYYNVYFTFDNFYDYMKHAKDVSIAFNSFNLTNKLKSFSPVKFDLLKLKDFDMLYPNNWKTDWKYSEKENCTKIYIDFDKGYTTNFMIKAYNNINKNAKELAEENLEILKSGGITFDGIDKDNEVYDKELDCYAFKLLNPKDMDNNPIDVFVEILSKGNKKILGTLLTVKTENKTYLDYFEAKRLLDISVGSAVISFLEGKKLEDTPWYLLYDPNYVSESEKNVNNN